MPTLDKAHPHRLTFSSREVSCSSSLTWSVPRGNVPFSLSGGTGGDSQGPVDSAIKSSVALMTFRTSAEMLQRETAEYFCLAQQQKETEDKNSTLTRAWQLCVGVRSSRGCFRYHTPTSACLRKEKPSHPCGWESGERPELTGPSFWGSH